MKKKHHTVKSEEKVIFFPGMIEKLITDGLAFAEDNNYIKASECFDQASMYTELDDTILSVYVLTLLETNRQLEAKLICEDLLKNKSDLIEQIVELYLTILLDLKDYNEVDKVLNKLLVDSRFTNERKKNFLQLKELSGRLAKEQESLLDQETVVSPNVEKERFALAEFTSLNIMEQEKLLQESFHKDITEAISSIITIVESKQVTPTIQTLAFLLLGAKDVTTEVTIEKFGLKEKVSPVSPPSVNAVSRIDAVKRHMQDILEKDPSKLQMAGGLVHSHAYALFPFDWLGYTNEAVAQAYVNYVETLFGNECDQTNELDELISLLESPTKGMEHE